MNLNLENKVALVIGGGGYLCSEMSRALSKEGVKVAVADKNIQDAHKVSKEIMVNGGTSKAYHIDVTQKQDHEELLKAILYDLGDIDILINGQGVNAPTPFFEITLDVWNKIIDTNLKGTFLSCQTFGHHMVENQKGSIINISSASSNPPLSRAFTYSISKAGISNLTKNLAREWAPFVRINSLKPGFLPTEWSKKHFLDKNRKEAILNHTPMHRFGHPEELVGAVLWLASDNLSSFVTGAEITVDGGFSAMTI